MLYDFDIYKTPPTTVQIVAWREELQQKHRATIRRYRFCRIFTGVLALVLGLVFFYLIVDAPPLTGETLTLFLVPFILLLIISVPRERFKCGAAELESSIQNLSDIDPSTQRVGAFDLTVTCDDLIALSEQYPEVKTYIGEVNRMGRLLTSGESWSIGVWVRRTVREGTEREKEEKQQEVMATLAKIGV